MLHPSLIVSKKKTAPFLFCCLAFSPLPLSTLQNQLFYVPSRGPPCESSLFHICGIFVDRISHISIFPYLLPLTPVISKSLFSRENSTKSFFFTWKSDEITLIQFLRYFIILHTIFSFNCGGQLHWFSKQFTIHVKPIQLTFCLTLKILLKHREYQITK